MAGGTFLFTGALDFLLPVTTFLALSAIGTGIVLLRRPLLAGLKVRQHGEDPAMVVLAFGNVELEEDVADVGFDGALADDQAIGDPDVRQPLGHQAEHAALASREASERPAAEG